MRNVVYLGCVVFCGTLGCDAIEPIQGEAGGGGAGFETSAELTSMSQAEASAGGATPVVEVADQAEVAMSDSASAAGASASRHHLMGLDGYPAVRYPEANPETLAKKQLGQILFWDEQLSGDDTVACGTCHMPHAGGSDPRSAEAGARLPGRDELLDATPGLLSDDRRGSPGMLACDENFAPVGDRVQVTGRKSPSALDAMFFRELFWDGRASGNFVDPDTGETLIVAVEGPTSGLTVSGALESQAMGPLMSEVEMACADPSWSALTEKLERVAPLALATQVPVELRAFIDGHGGSYPQLFAAAFEASSAPTAAASAKVITPQRVAFAIATYERSLTSDQTPWDRWNGGEAGALSAEQVRGYEVFMTEGRCALCHAPPLFTDLQFHYLGFHPADRDPGRGGLDGQDPNTRGQMKTPSLRNVGLREPGGLLHQGDGPGHDLRSVLEAYREGSFATGDTDPAADPLLGPLTLTDEDLAALEAFLREGLTDPRVAAETAPFDRPMLGGTP